MDDYGKNCEKCKECFLKRVLFFMNRKRIGVFSGDINMKGYQKLLASSMLWLGIFQGCSEQVSKEEVVKPKQEEQIIKGKRNWRNAYLQEADLSGMDLSGVDLSGGHVKKGNLRETNLENAILVKTNFEEADMQGANLKGSNSSQASFYRANLHNANFEGADITGANFRDCNVSGANFQEVKGMNEITKKILVQGGATIGGS